MTRAVKAEAIAAFERKVDQLDALHREIAAAEKRVVDLVHQRDHLLTSIETLCDVMGWDRETAPDSYRRERSKKLLQQKDGAQPDPKNEKNSGPDLLSGVA